MSQQHEIIVLDSSSDDDDSESEAEMRITVRGAASKPPAAKKTKTPSATSPRVYGNYLLTREEQYLLGTNEEDESDDGSDYDDDYDDRDDSFGDGARAFARKRRRPPSSRPASSAKRPKTPTRGVASSNNRSKPPPSRTAAPARRADRSDSESDDLSDNIRVDVDDDGDDGPFRHSNMVKNMEQARAMRAQANAKAAAKPTEPPRRGVMKAQRKTVDVDRARSKLTTNGTSSKAAAASGFTKAPLAARKSVVKSPTMAIQAAKRSRSRREQDSDEYESEASSEEESDEEEEDQEDEDSESDRREIVRKRPAPKKTIEEIEISDEDSASESDSEEPDSEDQARLKQPPKKKPVGRARSQAPLSRAKPPPIKEATLPAKSKPVQKAPPPRPVHRSSPPLPTPAPAAPRPRQEQVPTSRPARAVAALPENMSVEDMQAQERELAYFKQLQKKKEPSSQSANSTQQSRNRSSSNSARSANGARKGVSTQRVYRLPRQDSGTSVESTVSSAASRAVSNSTSREPKQLARTKAPPYYVPPALREGFSTTGTRHVTTTISVAADASMSFAAAEKVDHIPLLHNTSWRERLQFVRAPLNILPSKRGRRDRQAFLRVKERELCEFDDTGLVGSLADITSPPKVSTGEVLTQNYESQDAVNSKVRRVIDTILPVLKQCHQRRVLDIITEMRSSLPWCLPTADSSIAETSRRLRGAPQVGASADLSPIERVHAKRILHASLPRAKMKRPNALVGTIRYILGFPRQTLNTEGGEEEDGVQEISRFPETVIEFGDDLAPMRQSCTWMSVKTNIRVDDDPLLRYIPHLGDKGRVNIDPRRYQSTTLDKDRAIVIELPDGGASDGEDPVKIQEQLESWRSDVVRLVVETRSAMDDEVMEYLLCMVIKECGRSPKVFQALRDIGGFAEPITDYDVIQKREDTGRFISKRIKELHQCLEGESVNPAVNSTVVREFVSQLVRTSNVASNDDSVSQKLRPPLSSFSSNYLQYPDCKGLRRGKSVGQTMEWYRDLFCRRCYSYDCQQHGIQHPQPSQRMDPLNPVVKKSGVGLSRAKKGNGSADGGVIEIDSSSSSSSEDSQAEGNNDDAQSTISGSVDGEDDTVDAAERRRSRRSQTRASTLASASLQVQEVMVEKERKKNQRKQAKQLRKLVRQVDDSEYLDDSYRDIIGPIMDTLISPAPDSSCGAFCWKASAAVEGETSHPDAEVSDVLRTLLRKVIPVLGENACIIARLCEHPRAGISSERTDSCAAIHRYIESERSKTDGSSLFSSAAYQDRFHDKSEHRRQTNPYRSSAALHSGNRELIKRTRMNRAQQQTKEREHRYEACKHSGECNDGNCECLKRGHDCDKACSCSRDCANRNHGCTCVPGQCRTKACSCYSAGRECDPDFCFSCGAHEAAVMEFDGTQRVAAASDVGICRNVSLLRGVHKKIGVAFSATHGWGAYALEPIRKGDFVYEYRGALISDDEAERRGNIYDAIKVSYLFDVNSDEVVDAMRKGNKIKFANHRMQEVANLETKILVVRGEHRIALFAKWDLHVGEELFFDYGYTNETAPEWSQLRTPHNSRYADSDIEDDDDELKELLRLQSREDANDDDDI